MDRARLYRAGAAALFVFPRHFWHHGPVYMLSSLELPQCLKPSSLRSSTNC
jgi:hypothetical protein